MKKKIVTFRMDDLCPSMDNEKFERVIQIFEQYNVKPLLGIVPDNKDSKLAVEDENPYFWNRIRELTQKGYDVAMHGYQHSYDICARGIVDNAKASEFAGHSYEIQDEKIRKGRAVLQSHSIDTEYFFAPGHSYDNNTILALYANGFKYISDGRAHWAYKINNVCFIPCRKYEIAVRCRGISTICIHANGLNSKIEDCIKKTIESNRSNIYSFHELCQDFDSMSGNCIYMKLDEKLYVFYERYVRTKLSPAYQKMKKIIKQDFRKEW